MGRCRTPKDETKRASCAMLLGPVVPNPDLALAAGTPWESLGRARRTPNCCRASSLA